MKLGILSDLHLYFDKTWDYEPREDVFYLCAGDIAEDEKVRNAFITKHQDHMFTVLGNHDFYGGHFWIGPGESIIKGDYKIAGATLWTHMDPVNFIYSTHYLNDYSQISGMTYQAYNQCHEMQKEYLLNSEADIIVSHHAPSYLSVHEKYKDNPYNFCFVSDLNLQIRSMKKPPKLWVHGHTHDPFMYWIDKTLVVCHPKGYPNEKNYKNYTPLILEV